MRFLCILLLGALLGCVKAKEAGGDISTEDSAVTTGFPTTIQVVGRLFCTGTAIAPRAVLTASHCLEQATKVEVRTEEGVHRVDQWWRMGTGQVATNDDLAILYLETPLTELKSYTPIGTSAKVGDRVSLVGFGCSDLSDKSGVGVKRAGTNVLSEVGDRLEVSTPWSHLRKIVGPSNRAGSCHGDSGGPLFLGEKIIGVVHSGIDGGEFHISSYTNLTRESVRQFLEKTDKHWSLSLKFE
jgi:hypothetical protein